MPAEIRSTPSLPTGRKRGSFTESREEIGQRRLDISVLTNTTPKRGDPFSIAFAEARERTAKWATREFVKKNKTWPIYDSGVKEYQKEFGNVLDQDFRSFLRERKREKGQVFVLDVMGTGGFLPNYPVDGEVAITLQDHRSEAEKERDKAYGKLVIAGVEPSDFSGDVLRNTPWLKAKKFLDEHDTSDLPGFDLTTIRPYSGWEALAGLGPVDNKFTRLLTWIPIQRSYALASEYGGTTLVDLPGLNCSRWISRLQQVSGIEVKADDLQVRITKLEEPPALLPKM